MRLDRTPGVRGARIACGLWLTLPAQIDAQQLVYPPAPHANVEDNYFGHRIADPFRPLETLDGPATKAWVSAENALTQRYLVALAPRDSITALLTTLWNYPRVGVPVREAGKLWFRANAGLERQSVLYRVDRPGARRAAVLDPNALSTDASVALGQWSVSPDRHLLAYTTALGGSDLEDIHLRDLRTGRDLPEVVPRIKFSNVSWTRDSKGFFYSRYRGSVAVANLSEADVYHQLWYHRIGGAERLIFERPDDSTASAQAAVSDDGRWLYINSQSGTTNNRLWVAALGNPKRPNLGAAAIPVTTAEDAVYLEMGDRSPDDSASYPDDDLEAVMGGDGQWRFLHKDGTPY